MSTTTCGIFALGFVFGYLLYYAVRHTDKFNIELLSSAIGAIGGGALVGHFEQTPGWIGPYGIGIGIGFLFYLALALVLLGSNKFRDTVGGGPVMLLSQTLLGTSNDQN
jgi:hypothetical protein